MRIEPGGCARSSRYTLYAARTHLLAKCLRRRSRAKLLRTRPAPHAVRIRLRTIPTCWPAHRDNRAPARHGRLPANRPRSPARRAARCRLGSGQRAGSPEPHGQHAFAPGIALVTATAHRPGALRERRVRDLQPSHAASANAAASGPETLRFPAIRSQLARFFERPVRSQGRRAGFACDRA